MIKFRTNASKLDTPSHHELAVCSSGAGLDVSPVRTPDKYRGPAQECTLPACDPNEPVTFAALCSSHSYTPQHIIFSNHHRPL